MKGTVEIEIARLRALTPSFISDMIVAFFYVEIEIARLRALTPNIINIEAQPQSRNRNSPTKGIDTYKFYVAAKQIK